MPAIFRACFRARVTELRSVRSAIVLASGHDVSGDGQELAVMAVISRSLLVLVFQVAPHGKHDQQRPEPVKVNDQ
jgi:hypothetical protein